MKRVVFLLAVLSATACTHTVYVDRPVKVPYPVERYIVPADLPMPEPVARPTCQLEDGIPACLRAVATWVHQLETHANVSEQLITDHNAALAEMRAEHPSE